MKNPEDTVADQFGLNGDPLAELNEGMQSVETDWFEYHYNEYVDRKDIKEETKRHYKRAYRDWKEHMEQYDRHPTLPNDRHVESFVDVCLERMSGARVRKKLNQIKGVYEWMQESAKFPHPTNYNPFLLVKTKREADLSREAPDDYPKLTLEDVKATVENIKHLGERAATVFQLKTGVRSSELANIRLKDIHITNAEVMSHYDEMGDSDQLDDVANAVYIPPERVRSGNKREMPTVIPLDDETRRVLVDWLLIRPDNGSPWLFLTQKGKQMEKSSLGHIWRKHWWPEYEYSEEDQYRSVTPHYARHWFSTWMRTQVGMSEPKVQYLRGDKMGPDIKSSRSAFHRYVHTYYDDVVDEYRASVFKLGL